jgi:NTP pyrophosphatase (non-canonical NTP hydrolase)
MATKARVRLNLDLDSLFPGDTITIGEQTIDIRPLGIQALAICARKLKGFGALLEKEGVTWDNYNRPENLLKLATILLEQFPEVLEEASNIHIDDLKELPLDVIVEILNKVIEVNIASKEKLEGNFKSLVEKMGMSPIKKDKSQKLSKS